MKRKERLRKYLKDNNAEIFYSSIGADLVYFASYFGEGVYIFTDENDILMANALNIDIAEKSASVKEIIQINNTVSKIIKTKISKGSSVIISEKESVSTFRILKRAGLKVFLKDTRILRAQKEEFEVKLIKKAYEIVEKAVKDTLAVIREGVRELDIAAEISYRIRRGGAESESFNPIVVFGENTSIPHAISGMRRLKKGDLILMDVGAKFKGYCSDITRCFSFGSKNIEAKRYYRLLKDAFERALETLSSGEAEAKSVDNSARKVLEKAGVGKNFVHGLGHGIGLEVHELPRLEQESDDRLIDSMVFTIEPGVYFNGEYGLRLEDCVYLKSEPILLTKLPRRIIEI